ncbi:hypothetical protein FGO68_gene16783 [Halteria grandinella]|uniref:Uncharacterized protein n=1 Tax=Halteria grandinella TaxID=5974 RepID=A0A8J8NKQ8_HALGN|nr:hypothetical protein FGO68_gene16783 [Halteria grandinella]
METPQKSPSDVPSRNLGASSLSKSNPSLSANPTAQFSQPDEPTSASKPYMSTDESNNRLKIDLAQLIDRLEQALAKFKERKDKQRQHQSLQSVSDDPKVEKDLKSAQFRIATVKRDIHRLRQTLEQQYDVGTLTELENDLKAKESQISKINEQISQIRRVSVNQERAMSDINKEEEYASKIRAINDEVRKAKGNVRNAMEKQKEIDRGNQEQHRAIMAMEERCRKLQGMIAAKKGAQQVTQRRVSENEGNKRSSMGKQEELGELQPTDQELELSIKVTQDLIKEEEKKFKKLQYDLDLQLVNARSEVQIEETRVKEKEQDLRIVELKIREIKRQQQMFVVQQRAAMKPPVENSSPNKR